MKKLLFSTLAAMVTIAAAAQNKAIDRLVDRYADAEGFTVVNMEGEAIKGLSSMIANSKGTIDPGNGIPAYDIGEVLEEIVSVKAVVFNGVNDAFALEAREAFESGDYSPLLSRNADGQIVKVVTTEIKRGKYRKNKEIAVFFTGSDKTVLVRVIGKIDIERLAEIAGIMQKQQH